MISILFVCLSNICRSPTLEAVLWQLAKQRGIEDQLHIDSSAIEWWHIGEKADPRTLAAALKKGIEIDHIAQQFEKDDFNHFDYILAVDQEVLSRLHKSAENEEQKSKISLASEFSQRFKGEEIPDPYYSDEKSFDLVFEMAQDISEGILRQFFHQ